MNIVALVICGISLALYLGILAFYIIRIQQLKKLYPSTKEKGEEKQNTYFWGVLISSIILIVLPVLIPFENYMIAVICACAILGEIIAFRERVSKIMPAKEEKKNS